MFKTAYINFISLMIMFCLKIELFQELLGEFSVLSGSKPKTKI